MFIIHVIFSKNSLLFVVIWLRFGEDRDGYFETVYATVTNNAFLT